MLCQKLVINSSHKQNFNNCSSFFVTAGYSVALLYHKQQRTTEHLWNLWYVLQINERIVC